MLSSSDLQTLKAVWCARKSQLTLNTYGDCLFEALQSELPPPAEVMAILLDCAYSATSPSEIRVPLWTYQTRYWTRPGVFTLEDAEEDNATIYQNGWHWTVGTTQGLQPKPVDLIVKKTDVLPRLAALYGPCFHCVRKNLTWRTTERYTVTETTLWLVFSPRDQPAPPQRTRYVLQPDETVEINRGADLETPPPSPRGEDPPPLKRPCYCHFKTDL
jgi:hypothetical protein